MYAFWHMPFNDNVEEMNWNGILIYQIFREFTGTLTLNLFADIDGELKQIAIVGTEVIEAFHDVVEGHEDEDDIAIGEPRELDDAGVGEHDDSGQQPEAVEEDHTVHVPRDAKRDDSPNNKQSAENIDWPGPVFKVGAKRFDVGVENNEKAADNRNGVVQKTKYYLDDAKHEVEQKDDDHDEIRQWRPCQMFDASLNASGPPVPNYTQHLTPEFPVEYHMQL